MFTNLHQKQKVSFVYIITDCQTETLGNLPSNQIDSVCNQNSTGSIVIPNGVACFDGNSSGSVLLYRCDEGYTLMGNTNRTCLSDGNWSGEIAECQISPCKLVHYTDSNMVITLLLPYYTLLLKNCTIMLYDWTILFNNSTLQVS